MGTVTNWGTAIYASLANALSLFFGFIPKLVGFLVILLIGWIVAAALDKAVTLLLRRVGFDRLGDRIGMSRFTQQANIRMDPASLLGKIVFWFVFLIFLVPACNALELNSVSSLVTQIISYIPNVFVAVIVLLLGMLLSNVVADLVRGTTASARMANPNFLANIARYAILGFTALVALEQLQIAPALITTLFTAIVGAIALACGLAFGLGGRESAQRLLERSESRLTSGSMDTGIGMSQPFNVAPPMGKNASAESTYTTPVSPEPVTPGQVSSGQMQSGQMQQGPTQSGQARPGQGRNNQSRRS
ncbi:hypothetical protein KDA_11130 [Dictyobacter alpinus]|uniref:Small-conductance mechanosensitive ion channel n=1 Tax=Dictyobacter alpinus TaxID=2014873 RepID=A0A402B2Q6_9CHLR|nr:small-conductance mechanosensitive ion channel [Dictyobacter alpinus]GCE25629.1 hypothetical protein KDA_11130 [Dictyobacter alpinus]